MRDSRGCSVSSTMLAHTDRRWRGQPPLFATLGLLAAAGFLAQLFPAPAAGNNETAGITQEQADAILQELKSIRELLEGQNQQQARQTTAAVPDTARVSVKDRFALGAGDAPVTIVEFTDYECPFCKRFHQTTFRSLSRDYIDTGKVRWFVLDLPLPMHPNANRAAQAVHCAGEQDKFWEMRKVLFENAPLPNSEFLPEYGQELGLDQRAFDDCLASNRYLNQIVTDSKAAAENRITGTPTFIIGKSGGDWVEGKRIIGAQSYAVFDSAIRLVLPEP